MLVAKCFPLLGPVPRLVLGIVPGVVRTRPVGDPSPPFPRVVIGGEVRESQPEVLVTTFAESTEGAAAPSGGPNSASPRLTSVSRA